jgi:hypothetical protein
MNLALMEQTMKGAPGDGFYATPVWINECVLPMFLTGRFEQGYAYSH